jgi:hypothetical protein
MFACQRRSGEGGRGCVHQGMGKADFGTINSTIARGFHEGE